MLYYGTYSLYFTAISQESLISSDEAPIVISTLPGSGSHLPEVLSQYLISDAFGPFTARFAGPLYASPCSPSTVRVPFTPSLGTYTPSAGHFCPMNN